MAHSGEFLSFLGLLDSQNAASCRRPHSRRWLMAAFATVAEPVSFQLLRHISALLGWASFLLGVNDWSPQPVLPEKVPVGGIK